MLGSYILVSRSDPDRGGLTLGRMRQISFNLDSILLQGRRSHSCHSNCDRVYYRKVLWTAGDVTEKFRAKEGQMKGANHASANEDEYYVYSIMGTSKWLVAHAMRNAKDELIDEAEKVDDSQIVLQQDLDSVAQFGDCIHLMGGSLISIFAVHKKVLSIFQEYRLQPHKVIARCRLLDKRGAEMPLGADYQVMHFDHDSRYECEDKSKRPTTQGFSLSPSTVYFSRKRVPPFDFFQDVKGWIFSVQLVERIKVEKFSNFPFERVVLTDGV